jgi:hypothetical protein
MFFKFIKLSFDSLIQQVNITTTTTSYYQYILFITNLPNHLHLLLVSVTSFEKIKQGVLQPLLLLLQ